MARTGRLKSHLDGQAYHVMNRTVRQAFLFDDDVTKEWIYKEILALASIYFVDLHAIAVMSNHYHIVLTVRKPELRERDVQARFEQYQKRNRHPKIWRQWLLDEWIRRLTDLSAFMQDLNLTISRYVNKRDRVRGRLWGDRFKSTLLDDDVGFLRYIEGIGERVLGDISRGTGIGGHITWNWLYIPILAFGFEEVLPIVACF